jgi:hypothetical protein
MVACNVTMGTDITTSIGTFVASLQLISETLYYKDEGYYSVYNNLEDIWGSKSSYFVCKVENTRTPNGWMCH